LLQPSLTNIKALSYYNNTLMHSSEISVMEMIMEMEITDSALMETKMMVIVKKEII